MTEEITPTKTLDVCGEICPYPDMNTMTTLKKMQKGEILEVLLDYPLSVERIPRNFKETGTQAVEGRGAWRSKPSLSDRSTWP